MVLGQKDRVADRHVLGQPDLLEGAAQAFLGAAVGREHVEPVSVELHMAHSTWDETGDGVEEGRLSGAVGPDDPDDCPPLGRERHSVDGGQSAEAHRDLLDGEEVVVLGGGHRSPVGERGEQAGRRRVGLVGLGLGLGGGWRVDVDRMAELRGRDDHPRQPLRQADDVVDDDERRDDQVPAAEELRQLRGQRQGSRRRPLRPSAARRRR